MGVELHQRPQAARGALLPFEWLNKTRGARAVRGGPGRPVRGGLTTRTGPGEARGNKAVAFHNLQAFSKCARRKP